MAKMTLYCTQAKCFVHAKPGGGTNKFLLQPGPRPQAAPMWVAETPTFAQGIKDRSIVNLTPPHLMPGYVPEAVVVEEPDEEEDKQPVASDDLDENEEQKEVPKAPFGGQPMTPVPPAPKIGGITPGARKR